MPRTPEVVRRSDRDILRMWWFSLGISGVVVGVVAALLAQIIAAARSIDRRADGIWTVGKQIAGNTVSIWMLARINDQVARMLHAAKSIDGTAASIDTRLRALADADSKAS
ncbi:MAG: hypothetical protein M3336_08180 [Chloroflexota bacterium]|nr:hypothetical protein [Chloroflexota bacterium]